ncbi:MAG: hypothetical protein AAF702_48445 [Chloroflexota bacterium]
MNHIANCVTRVTLIFFIALITTSSLQGCGSSADSNSVQLIPELRLVNQANNGRYDFVELVGLHPSVLAFLNPQPQHDFQTLSEVLAIYTKAENDTKQSAKARQLVGRFSIENDRLQFHPRYPFEPGLDYVARANLVELKALLGDQAEAAILPTIELVELAFSLPLPKSETHTSVTNVFPSADILPENLLRFYVHFSDSMRSGEAYDHIRVLDSNGEVVERPFLYIGRELWNPAKTRLTVMFDPGRIKRGMAPNQQAGLPLKPDDTYQLVIDNQWEDENGNQLVDTYRKVFRVSHADFDSPQLSDWQVIEPTIDTVESLLVQFPEPMDHALLQRLLSVHYLDRTQNNGPTRIQGTIAIEGGEQQWQFTPTSPWKQGQYRLVIDTLLEDIAGNSLRRPFDADLQDIIQNRDTDSVVELDFSIEATLGKKNTLRSD